ncbi:MAG: class I SAM-dependent methyltransferase [Luteimonas sp.]
MSDDDLQQLYRHRFAQSELPAKNAIWEVLCRFFFQRFVDAENDTVLDLACGYGEFINNIRAKKKIAVDLNPDSPAALRDGIEFHAVRADALEPVASGTVDIVFTSNFFEHLPDKTVLAEVLQEINRVLRPGGTLIAMGPNIRYLPGEYWDFIDHHLPLSERSLTEALQMSGFRMTRVVDRFLPYTTQSRLPKAPLLVRIYLSVPAVWRFFGKQFLVFASKA